LRASKNVGLLWRPINRDAKMCKPAQKRCSGDLRQASLALAHDECIAHFDHHRGGRRASSVRKRSSANRATGCSSSKAQHAAMKASRTHEGYLCPSCLAEASSSTAIFPVRCRNAFIFRIGLSTSDCRRCASNDPGYRVTMSGDDNRLPHARRHQRVGKASLSLRGMARNLGSLVDMQRRGRIANG
jgi:hypothetical protein